MRVNKQKVRELMTIVAPGEDGEGCYNRFAKLTKMSVGSLHMLLNDEKRRGGLGFLGKLKTLCDKMGIPFDINDFIIWDQVEPQSTDDDLQYQVYTNPAIASAIIMTVEGILELVAANSFPVDAELVIEEHLNLVCSELNKFTKEQMP